MPFTPNEFLDVFGAYNDALWPLAALLWLLTAAAGAAFVMGAEVRSARLRLLLAGHWLWVAFMYHVTFFTAINPAAWLFAALFVVQAILLIASGSSDDRARIPAGSARRFVSSVIIAYGLLYPAVAWVDGFAYPRMPTFGVPCPTVLLTIGYLIAVSTPSLLLSIVPMVWSLVGVSAVWLFGVHADLALPAAAALLAVDLIFRRSQVMKKLSFASISTILAAMLVLMPTSLAFAQAAQHDHGQQAQTGGMKMDAQKMEQMAAKKNANTDRLTALMAEVENATGDAKVAAMADVIAVLVEERAAMHEHCASMMSTMPMMKK